MMNSESTNVAAAELKAPDYSYPKVWSSCECFLHATGVPQEKAKKRLIEMGIDPAQVTEETFPTYAEAFKLSEEREARETPRMTS